MHYVCIYFSERGYGGSKPKVKFSSYEINPNYYDSTRENVKTNQHKWAYNNFGHHNHKILNHYDTSDTSDHSKELESYHKQYNNDYHGQKFKSYSFDSNSMFHYHDEVTSDSSDEIYSKERLKYHFMDKNARRRNVRDDSDDDDKVRVKSNRFIGRGKNLHDKYGINKKFLNFNDRRFSTGHNTLHRKNYHWLRYIQSKVFPKSIFRSRTRGSRRNDDSSESDFVASKTLIGRGKYLKDKYGNSKSEKSRSIYVQEKKETHSNSYDKIPQKSPSGSRGNFDTQPLRSEAQAIPPPIDRYDPYSGPEGNDVRRKCYLFIKH